jgi:RNA polymerase sigma-70 factor (ECF subfamily)
MAWCTSSTGSSSPDPERSAPIDERIGVARPTLHDVVSSARDADAAPEAAVNPDPLLAKVAAGDRSAAAACIDRYGPVIFATARRMLSTSAEAEDAVQDVFVALWQAAETYDPTRGSEPVFVMTLARRRIIDRLRRAGRRPREVRLEDSPVRGVELPLDRGVEAARTVEALRNLSDARREVVQLCVVEGWSHAEAAQRTGLPLGTVKSHLKRALAQLRNILTKGGEA